MGMYRICNSAKDRKGNKIQRGDTVLYLGWRSGERFTIQPTPVKVVNIHHQGSDGTILTCDRPPNADYPGHYTCRATNTEKQL